MINEVLNWFVMTPTMSRHILDKCSTVCEVASALTPREAGINGQRFSFFKLNLAYLHVFALNR